ncbi:hypothetical protein D3C81_2109630 [compost metagenome]
MMLDHKGILGEELPGLPAFTVVEDEGTKGDVQVFHEASTHQAILGDHAGSGQ